MFVNLVPLCSVEEQYLIVLIIRDDKHASDILEKQ